ncbi:M13 family metallopeptidase [Psychrosphaera ytuae]|uniref:M13 family metallopeptidase n=1 Tax=Psychrosphaera ytuae TaxID=2820710 RepID=A0A975DAA3_9GAMM|nr:M13 family metallopeptidase [Psychrosphaera ytuae]QTH63500.1 M13 family metallopeptidase [Psychrosphaera ytuae]
MNKISKTAFAVALALGALSLSGCSPKQETTDSSASSQAQITEAAAETSVALTSGIDLENMDKKAAPQHDFYIYVNGTWLDKTTIPADKSNYGSFTKLYDDAQENLKTIILRAAAKPNVEPGSDEQKLGDFYNSYMDEKTINEKGLSPLQPTLAQINKVNSHQEVGMMMAELYKKGVTGPLSWYVSVDAKQSDQYGVYVNQSGLGLPDRDYYFKEDKKSEDNRQAYAKYVADMLSLAGIQDAEAAGQAVLELETKLADKMWTRVQSRDANARYNKMDSQAFAKYMGAFPWTDYANTLGLETDQVIASQNTYLNAFGQMFDSVDVQTWKHYMTIRLLSEYAPQLSSDFADRQFAFYGKTLRGIEQQQPRWKRAVNGANSVLGELLGKLYVAEHFKPEAKERMEKLVQNVIKGFEVGIKELEWMSEETKVAALEKLAKFTPKIGYPDKWTDYSDLEIKEDDLIGNYMRYNEFALNDMLNKLGGPIDRTEWFMTPQTVNAYYSPTRNEIVFPAAILQPPFFNLEAEDAVNYGGIGAVIGHEIGHGFDDQGAKYDGDGNLRNWWTESDKEQFQARGKKLAEQYSKFEPFEDEFVNGELTLGENIGDLGGLTIAYKAYKLSLDGKPSPVLDGFTGEQRVFLGWAQVWRRLYRDDELRNRLVTDPHSPSRYRVNGVIQNMPEFYQAFGVKQGDGHYLPEEERVKIW